MRRPISAKILHVGEDQAEFYNAGLEFLWSHPKIRLGAKYMQNLARFRTTSKFGGEYLRKRRRYSKSLSYSFDNDYFRVRRNKTGVVWSSNLGDLDVELYPPKAHISENHISTPRWCIAPNFYTRQTMTKSYQRTPHRVRGFSLQFFLKGRQKQLKMQQMSAYNFGVICCRPTKL